MHSLASDAKPSCLTKHSLCSRSMYLKKLISMAADSARVTCNIFLLLKQFTCNSWTSLYMYVITITVINLELVSEIEGYTTAVLTRAIWVCRGQYSTLTYDDCQAEYYSTIGCYFMENFAFYKSCFAICNNVTSRSIQEEKCRAYCNGRYCCREALSLRPETVKEL